MSKSKFPILILMAFVVLAVLAWIVISAKAIQSHQEEKAAKNSMPAPSYLSVTDYKQCLATADHGSWKGWCMPSVKPDNCPADSWTKLKQLPIASVSCNT